MNDQKLYKWKHLKSKYLYEDPWLKLRLDNVIRPDGNEGTYSVVEFKGGIGVVPVTKDGKICIVGQSRYAANRYSWELPKGALEKFDHTEEPLEIAKKELEEETGYISTKWTALTYVHTLLGSTNDIVHLYLAQDVENKSTQHLEATEDIKIRLVTLEEFHQMIESHQITDAASIAAVLLCQTRNLIK